MRAPTGQRVAVDGVEQRLGDGLEEVVGPEVGLPEALARAEELVGRGAGDDEVFGEVDAADAVEAADEGGAPDGGLVLVLGFSVWGMGDGFCGCRL